MEQFVFEVGAVFVFEAGDSPVEAISAVGELAVVGFPDFDCLFDGEFDAGSGVVAQQRLGFVGDGVTEQLRKVSMWTGSVVDASMMRRRMPSVRGLG